MKRTDDPATLNISASRILTSSLCLISGAILTFCGGTLVPTTASAATAACTAAAAQAAAPAGLTVADIPDLNPALPATSGGVADIPAGIIAPGMPETCLVTGTVVTNPETGKTAGFGALLPLKAGWNDKFMFSGCGGNCGTVLQNIPTADQLSKGYPVWSTDGGHAAFIFTDTWAVTAPGHPDADAVTDFFFRANHAVIEAGKLFTRSYYAAAAIKHSYFMGCSDGGRDGMEELSNFPEDFDGIIAGDPYFDIGRQTLGGITKILPQLRSRQSALSPAQFSLAEKIILKRCDALDGVKDGLIQNPQLCHFNPQTDLPKCTGGKTGDQCFTQGQADALSVMISAITDGEGNVIEPGLPDSNVATGGLQEFAAFPAAAGKLSGPEPWNNDLASQPLDWDGADGNLKYLVYQGANNYNSVTTPGYLTPGFRFGANTPGTVRNFHAIVPDATVMKVDNAFAAAEGDDLRAADVFFREGRKLILYHGFGDGAISPYRTIQYFEALAKMTGGYRKLAQSAQLYLIPGMAHCSGGPGPNNFGQSSVQPQHNDRLHDALTALENWVEADTAPQYVIGTKFTNDDPAQPALRTMPICPFPAKAKYKGAGNMNDAQNWTCPAGDRSLLQSGPSGIQAGIGGRNSNPYQVLSGSREASGR